MSKSSGDFLTLNSLIQKGYSPLDYRYFALGSHYRNYLTFSFEALDSARQSRLALLKRAQPLTTLATKIESPKALEWKKRFDEAVADDLNIPAALGILHSALRDDELSAGEKGALTLDFDQILGLKLDQEEPEPQREREHDITAEEVEQLLRERLEARKERDFSRADEIRQKLSQFVEIKDTPQGTTWEWKR